MPNEGNTTSQEIIVFGTAEGTSDIATLIKHLKFAGVRIPAVKARQRIVNPRVVNAIKAR
jgi:hypothetical protein